MYIKKRKNKKKKRKQSNQIHVFHLSLIRLCGGHCFCVVAVNVKLSDF